MRLWDRQSVQEHIRNLKEMFEKLAVIGDPDVPKKEVVTQCLIHEERKQQDNGSSSPSKALSVSRQKKGP